MKSRLFWKLGLSYSVLLILVLLAVDIFVVRAIRQEYLASAFANLEALSQLAQARPPRTDDRTALKEWAAWMAESGSRVTLVASDGTVLADSDENPDRMENHASRPEISAALAGTRGRAVRFSPTLGHDLVYLAVRQEQQGQGPFIIRFSVPVHRLNEAQSGFRRRLWGFSLVILALSGGMSLLFFRTISHRIERLREFSSRVAQGDRRPPPIDRRRDELADLSRSMSETALHLETTIRTLTDERNRSGAILASMTEGVAVIGLTQRVTYSNEAFRRALGGDQSCWEGRPAVEVIPHSDLLSVIRKTLSGNDTVRSELVVGSTRTRSFSVTAAPVRSDGNTAGAVLVLHDITELRRLERARRDFLANVSHEFKTPLTAIQGFSETLLGGALEDSRNNRRFLEIIRDHALRLERLTSDLLRLSQIESGNLQLDMRPVAVADILEPCLETARLKADAKGIALEADCVGALPPVTGDIRSLQEILQNLLDNAVRYTPPGGRVLIRAASGPSQVVISVCDNGIGIAKSEQERIFERFYRVDAARSRESGGTGLGLSIVKHLVEVHGGSIRVESELGRGSAFHVSLPI